MRAVLTEQIVFIPGLTCDASVFEPQLELLEKLGWTYQIADVTAGSTVDEMASLTLSSSGNRTHVVGLSMGGYVALAMWRQAPQRVKSLILIGSSARGDSDSQRLMRGRLVEKARTGRFEEVVQSLVAVFLGKDASGPLKDRVAAMVDRVGLYVFARQQTAIAHRPDVRETLPVVAVPTLVICGGEDSINPPDTSAEIASGVPVGRLEVIPHVGHLCNLEAPETTNRLLGSFLPILTT